MNMSDQDLDGAQALSPHEAGALAFLTASVTLALQILMHRIVSAKLLNNYAFIVISLTMLGFAISGVALTFAGRRFFARFRDSLMWSACLLALTAMGSISAFAWARAGAAAISTPRELVNSFLQWTPHALLLTLPFLFAGLMLGGLLADERLPTRRIYALDLVGSALGALVVLPLFRLASVETLIAASLLALVAGSLVCTRPTRGPRVAGIVTTVILTGLFVWRYEAFSIYFPEGSMLAATRDPSSATHLEYKEWDPLARIEIASVRGRGPITGTYASLFGENREFLQRYRKLLTQNNYAFTYGVDWDGRPESLIGIEETIYASAYYASTVPRPKVAIIGVGGGFDVLTAIRFDASSITAIEINAATVNIVRNVFRDYFRHWVEDPRVHLINAEGRHYLQTSPDRFDVIQLSGVDSYSGTPGAAHVFSENYLYTAEAFDLYLSRLSENGVINMMRLEHLPPREMLRALTTAVGALRRIGITDPSRHIAVVGENTGFFIAILVKRTPFQDEELAKLKAWAGARPSFGVSASPGGNDRAENVFQHFLSLRDPRLERQFISKYPFDIHPAVDDRPFFFNFSYWWHLLPGVKLFPDQPEGWVFVPVLQLSLVLLAAAICVVMVVSILLPLAILARRRVEAPSKNRFAFYCAGAAIGYLAIEVALMQAFGLFLGHPNYAISVVLAALLLASGIGSLYARQIVERLVNVRYLSYLLAVVVLLEYLVAFPLLTRSLGLPFLVRALLTGAMVFPVGVCLGVFLPTALDQLKRESPELVPWAWGVNGIFSVLAPLLAVGIATTFGISVLLLSSLPIYIAIAWCLPAARPIAEATPSTTA